MLRIPHSTRICHNHLIISYSCAIKSANPGSSTVLKRPSDVKCARSWTYWSHNKLLKRVSRCPGNSTMLACRTHVHTSTVLQEVFRELQDRHCCKHAEDHQKCMELNLRCQTHLVVLGNGTKVEHRKYCSYWHHYGSALGHLVMDALSGHIYALTLSVKGGTKESDSLLNSKRSCTEDQSCPAVNWSRYQTISLSPASHMQIVI